MKPACLFLFIGLFSASACAEDWPCWRGPAKNGISRETGWRNKWPEGGPEIAWKASVGTGFSSVAVSQMRLFTMGNRENTDTVYCLDVDSGKTLWSHAYECPLDDRMFEGGPTATPTVDGDAVYTLGRVGHLFCFDAATGKVRWSSNVAEDAGVRIPGWGFSSSPVVHGKLLLLNVGESGTAVDKTTGKIVWTSADRDAGYNTPVLVRRGEKWVAILASSKAFTAVDVESGAALWEHRWLTRFGCNAADAVLSGERLFISSGYHRGAALLEWKDGEPAVVWENKELQNQLHSSVLVGEHLYGFDGQDGVSCRLKAVEFATGKVAWSEEWKGLGSLMAADGKLILLSEGGELIVAPASPTAFQPTARAAVISGKCWTAPVLANGAIYCRNADGDLVSVNVREKPR